MRPAAEVEAWDAEVESAALDSGGTERERMERVWALLERNDGRDIPSDEELLSASEWIWLRGRAESRGLSLPPVPLWLAELGGITEVARHCMAALIERASGRRHVCSPAEFLGERFDLEPGWHLAASALRELQSIGLIRGGRSEVTIMRGWE